MTKKTNRIKLNLMGFALLLLISCVKSRDFDPPQSSCNSDLVVNASYKDIKNLYIDRTIQIQTDLIIEGYVISSDNAGNFFSVLHFQDGPANPTEGFQIEIDLRDSHLFYPIGSKIFIKLKGLYLGKSKGVFKIGGVFTSFGNESVGRLPAAIVDQHIIISCNQNNTVEPVRLALNDLSESFVNTLVQLEKVEISESEIGLPFAIEQEETERTLINCEDIEIGLLNSGFSDFHTELLPTGNGTITGVLLRENDDFLLVIRDLGDISFNQDRCEDLVDEFTSTNVFFSELADPDNNASARFVELYNSGSESLSLKGWKIERFTNSSFEASSTIKLDNLTIGSESTLVISPNAPEFENVYGFLPDLGIGTNSPADSNGDDNLRLVDPFGVVVDVFGRIGEDGSETDHEFEDGRAFRNIEISQGNPVFTFSEWILYNDTGESGTINQPQIAPQDFSPGNRE